MRVRFTPCLRKRRTVLPQLVLEGQKTDQRAIVTNDNPLSVDFTGHAMGNYELNFRMFEISSMSTFGGGDDG